MKKKEFKTKLNLNKQIITTLNQDHLNNVKGGWKEYLSRNGHTCPPNGSEGTCMSECAACD